MSRIDVKAGLSPAASDQSVLVNLLLTPSNMAGMTSGVTIVSSLGPILNQSGIAKRILSPTSAYEIPVLPVQFLQPKMVLGVQTMSNMPELGDTGQDRTGKFAQSVEEDAIDADAR